MDEDEALGRTLGWKHAIRVYRNCLVGVQVPRVDAELARLAVDRVLDRIPERHSQTSSACDEPAQIARSRSSRRGPIGQSWARGRQSSARVLRCGAGGWTSWHMLAMSILIRRTSRATNGNRHDRRARDRERYFHPRPAFCAGGNPASILRPTSTSFERTVSVPGRR